MSRIVKFIARQEEPKRIGYKRVRRRKRVNLEDFGQLNLFSQEAKVISLQAHSSPFEHALQLEEDSNPAAIDFYRQAI